MGVWASARIGIWTCAVCGCPPVSDHGRVCARTEICTVPEYAWVCAYRDMRCVRVCARVRVSTCEGVHLRGVWGCVSARMHICAYAHTCAQAGFVRWRDNRVCSSSPLRLIVHTHTHTHMRGGAHMRVPLHVHMRMRVHGARVGAPACNDCAPVHVCPCARMHVCMQARMSM